MILICKEVLPTWYEQRLATHDEDYLHRSKLAQAQFPSLVERESKFGDECRTEKANADGSCNIRRIRKPLN